MNDSYNQNGATDPHEVHLLERLTDASGTYRKICERARGRITIVDLTSGRVEAVSQLDSEREAAAPTHEWIVASDYAGRVARTSKLEYVRWISDVGNVKLLNDRSVKEWFTFGNCSLWWLTSSAKKGQITSPYRWFFYAFELIDEAFAEGRIPEGAAWHLWVPCDATGRLLAEYIGSRGTVRWFAEKAAPPPETMLHRLHRTVLAPVQRIAEALRFSLFTRTDRSTESLATLRSAGNRLTLVATEYPKSWKPVPDAEKFADSVSACDFYLGTMPWAVRDSGRTVAWLSDVSTVESYKKWRREGLARQDLADATPWSFVDLPAACRLLAAQVRWVRAFNRLFENSSQERVFTYSGVDMGHWIVADIRDLCGGAGVQHMSAVEAYRKLAATLEPGAVVYRNEMFLNGRRISTGMKGRTLLMGVQHGIINEEATVYHLDPRDVQANDQTDHVHYCPVPDVFAAFGEHTHELLQRWGGYPAERVIPVGGVRHDNLVQRLANENPAFQRTRYGLPSGIPIILLCTQRARDAGRWFDMIIRSAKRLDLDVFVAVKAHQYHGGEEEIRRTADEQGYTNYRIFESDTYPLMACADIVVGGPSTIILESYLLGTPAITIAGSGDYETYPYREESLGRATSSVEEMTAALEECLQGKTTAGEDFFEERRMICERHLWNHSAGANARFARLLDAVQAGVFKFELQSGAHLEPRPHKHLGDPEE